MSSIAFLVVVVVFVVDVDVVVFCFVFFNLFIKPFVFLRVSGTEQNLSSTRLVV